MRSGFLRFMLEACAMSIGVGGLVALGLLVLALLGGGCKPYSDSEAADVYAGARDVACADLGYCPQPGELRCMSTYEDGTVRWHCTIATRHCYASYPCANSEREAEIKCRHSWERIDCNRSGECWLAYPGSFDPEYW